MHAARIYRYGDADNAGRTRPNGAAKLRNVNGDKECIKCHQWLSEDQFASHSGAADGLRGTCRLCSLVSAYNITRNEFESMREQQNGVCAICGDTPSVFVVDHDHACCNGRNSCGSCVRGLICHGCNTGLGGFKDRPDALLAAVVYLTR